MSVPIVVRGTPRRGQRSRLLIALAFLLVIVVSASALATVRASAANRTVTGCDPLTGKLVTRDIDQLLNPTREGPTPQYVAPDRNGTIGTIWTPSCEPTSTTGNGSCFLEERNQVLAVEVSPSLTKKLSPKLPVGLKLQVVWVVLRQVKNDSTTDFLSFFMISPIVTAKFPGKLTPEVAAQYTHSWYALYRVLTNSPAGTNLPSAKSVWTALSTYGQFLALGGLTKDTSALNIGSVFGAPVLPAPFLSGQFNGVHVGASVAGVSTGITNWVGPYAIDINKADPTNLGAILHGSAAPGGTPDAIATIPGDIVKIQPDLASASGLLGNKIKAMMTGLFAKSPVSWLTALQGSFTTGIVLDALDMGSFKTSTGIEQGGSIEMVVRVPLLLVLDFAPAGSSAQKEATGWWDTAKKDSKWAAWAKNARASANFSGGPYLGIRYTKKVDLAGRTPETVGNLALWQSIRKSYGYDPVSIAKLFGPDGSAAIQMYNGATVSVKDPLGALSIKIPGTKTRIGVGTLTGLLVSASLTESDHKLIDAWHNTPGQSGVSWQPWVGCKSMVYSPDPNAASYGPKFQSYFSPGPNDLFNPNAPKYTWPTSPGLSRLVQPLLDNVTTAFTEAATEVAASVSLATKIGNTISDAAKTAAQVVSCKVFRKNCPPKATLIQTDTGQLNNTVTRFYNDEAKAKDDKDGTCAWDSEHSDGYGCIVFNGDGAPTYIYPETGTLMEFAGLTHKASRTPQSTGQLPYCVPEWYRLGLAFHDSAPAFKNDPKPANTYYCSFWTP
jgi:hypothetical protein